jgi:hypothetical protein
MPRDPHQPHARGLEEGCQVPQGWRQPRRVVIASLELFHHRQGTGPTLYRTPAGVRPRRGVG